MALGASSSAWVSSTSPAPDLGSAVRSGGLWDEKLAVARASWGILPSQASRDRLSPEWGGGPLHVPTALHSQSDEMSSFSSRICTILLVVSYDHFCF